MLLVLCVLAPILGGAILHGPVLRFDLLPALKRPLDGGGTVRGRRIFGDNKTWRGALAIVLGAVLGALALSFWPAYWAELPAELQRIGPLAFGLLLGVGFVLGELPNSFLKRQLDIPPGTQRRSALGAFFMIYDQGDFVLGVWLVLAPLWVMPPRDLLLAFALSIAVHLLINVIGYAIGARRSPI